ncbi:hypothetical protein [Modicisalibacter sp. 'Wilcox']|uniref:hypothetical protein n=1 Tax=Modicisalibacter sp. 'Wilcox' TaxID=2679914 RepID=UPI0013D2CC91|nr:hypothetical protein [Modicisalibacter sp. 'Wilcox']
MTNAEFDSYFADYQTSCYLVFLERGDDLTSPPASHGENMVIGDHIRFINLFRTTCKLAGRPIPPFEVQGADFPGMEA